MSTDDGLKVEITVETAVDPETALSYYQLYRDTFGALATKAVARQLLHEHEFLEEMLDPRVQKYVAWDECGQVVGLSTLTSELETVPLISAAYFAHHSPEHTARVAVYYQGFTLVHRGYRQSRVFQVLTERVVELRESDRCDERRLHDVAAHLLDDGGFVARRAAGEHGQRDAIVRVLLPRTPHVEQRLVPR